MMYQFSLILIGMAFGFLGVFLVGFLMLRKAKKITFIREDMESKAIQMGIDHEI